MLRFMKMGSRPEERPVRGRNGLRWGAAGLGALAVVAAAAPASAQVQTVARQDDVHSDLVSLVRSQRESKSQWSFSASQQNDSFPGWLEWVPTRSDNRVPGTRQMDDDGWTAEVQLQATRTRGDEQWTGGLRYSMITQRGAWEPQADDYRGLRTDLVELNLQRNERRSLGDGSTLVWGLGGGLQGLGNLGGHTVQEQFHLHGGFGGRSGPALQSNFSTQHATVVPFVSGGVAWEKPLSLEQLQLRSSMTTSLALGHGLSTLQGQVGLNFQPSSRWNVESGVVLAGVHSNHPALNFIHPNGIRPGAYIETQVKLGSQLRAFGRVQTGGVQDEPVYLVGFSVGLGPRPWLRSSFQ